MTHPHHPGCTGVTRRQFLADTGMGFTGLALGALLFQDGIARRQTAAHCWQHTGAGADDIAVVRSLWTTDNDHGAQLQWHTGRHVREGAFPTIGSWVSYGLGTLNQNLPQYVVLGQPTGDCCGGSWTHGAAYLGAEHAGVRLNVGAAQPLPFVTPAGGVRPEEQAAEMELLGR